MFGRFRKARFLLVDGTTGTHFFMSPGLNEADFAGKRFFLATIFNEVDL